MKCFSFVAQITNKKLTDSLPGYLEYAEADCFFCFTALMSEIRDFFIKTLDESEGGIKQKMTKLSVLLKEKDLEVWNRLRDQELYPQYYSFRWLTLMLSQEFPLPDVCRIWDSVFADENRFKFLVDVCCAMIMLVCEPSLLWTELRFLKVNVKIEKKNFYISDSCGNKYWRMILLPI